MEKEGTKAKLNTAWQYNGKMTALKIVPRFSQQSSLSQVWCNVCVCKISAMKFHQTNKIV